MFFFEFSCFSYVCYVFICVVFDCKCKSLKKTRRKHNKQKETKTTTEQLEEKHTNKQHKYMISLPRTSANILCEPSKDTESIEISQPEPERYLFAVGSRAGYPVFRFFLSFCYS